MTWKNYTDVMNFSERIKQRLLEIKSGRVEDKVIYYDLDWMVASIDRIELIRLITEKLGIFTVSYKYEVPLRSDRLFISSMTGMNDDDVEKLIISIKSI